MCRRRIFQCNSVYNGSLLLAVALDTIRYRIVGGIIHVAGTAMVLILAVFIVIDSAVVVGCSLCRGSVACKEITHVLLRLVSVNC